MGFLIVKISSHFAPGRKEKWEAWTGWWFQDCENSEAHLGKLKSALNYQFSILSWLEAV